MKKLMIMMACFALAVLAAPVLCGGAEAGAALEGKWQGAGGSKDGKKFSEEDALKLKMFVTFKEGKYRIAVLGMDVEGGTYKIDASKTPATIDLMITEGNDKGKTLLGLYKLEGDKLTIANGSVGNPRPKDFNGGAGIELTILKRAK